MTIKDLRTRCGLSQRELSTMAGINYRSYQDYEQGSKPLESANGDVLFRLSTVLGCDISQLLRGQDLEGGPIHSTNTIPASVIQSQHFFCDKYKVWGRWICGDDLLATVFFYEGKQYNLPFDAVFTKGRLPWLLEFGKMQIESFIDEIEFVKKAGKMEGSFYE